MGTASTGADSVSIPSISDWSFLCEFTNIGKEESKLIPISFYLICSSVLYVVGLYCLVVKRNMIRLLIAIEIIMNAVNLNFIVFSRYSVLGFTDPLAHAFVLVSIAVGGCIIAVGLAITLHAYRHYRTLDVRKLRRLRH